MTASLDTHDDPHARLRRGVYLVLIAVGTGIMLGRILAVDSVDMLKIYNNRLRENVNLLDKRQTELLARGVSGPRLEAVLRDYEEKLDERLRIVRPFLSANDRSRWCTIRALVEPEMRVYEQVEVDGRIVERWVPYAIDNVIQEPTWDTIDMVKHDEAGRGGLGPDEGHLYSSKPPLLPTILAGEYWLIYKLTGKTLGEEPYAIGRFMLVTINVVPLVIYFLLLAGLVERFGTTDWGRVFVMAAAVFGTFLITFSVTLNNHLPGAISALIALAAAIPIWFDNERRWHYFALAGLFGAFTAANELPALAFFGLLSLALLWKAPGRTLLVYVPAALVVGAGFFGTNWIAHGDLRPPYVHRPKFLQATSVEAVEAAVDEVFNEVGAEPGPGAVKGAVQRAFSPMAEEVFRKAVAQNREMVMPTLFLETVQRAAGETYFGENRSAVMQDFREGLAAAALHAARQADPQADETTITRAGQGILDPDAEADDPENWYDYSYIVRKGGKTERQIGSYWRNPVGIDRGEEDRAVYALHCLVGHHGVFSLTPVWLLSVAGLGMWLVRPRDPRLRHLAVFVAALSAVCLVFYLFVVGERNYGGMTAGFRWMFWFAPMWLVAMLPAADWMAGRRWARGLALVLLCLSALSAAYPTWNPWTDPWIYNWLVYAGWMQGY